MLGEHLQIVPKSTSINTNLLLPIKYLRDVKDLMEKQEYFIQL